MQTEGISIKENVQFNIRPYSKPNLGNYAFDKKTFVVTCMMSGSILASPLKTSAEGKQEYAHFFDKQGSNIIRTSIQSYNGSKSHEQLVSSPNVKEVDISMKNHENVESVLKDTDYEMEVQPVFKFNNKLSFSKEIKSDFSEEVIHFKETDYEIKVKNTFNFK